MCYFYFNRLETKNDFYQLFYHCVKTNCKGKKSRVLKTQKNYVYTIWQFSWFIENLNNNQDPHRHIENDATPGAEYFNGMIQMSQKQKKFCRSQFHTQSITRWWNHRRYKFVRFKAKGSFKCGSSMGQRLCRI